MPQEKRYSSKWEKKTPSVRMRARYIVEDICTMQVWPQTPIYFSKDCSISIKGHKTGV